MVKNKNKKIDFIIISPLSLLLLLPASGFIAEHMTAMAAHKEIAVLRYFSIPLVGLSLGLVLFLGILRKDWKLPDSVINLLEEKYFTIITAATALFVFFFSTILVLRYTTIHTSIIELGGYDNRIWRISSAENLLESMFTTLTGHFQPILILHGLLYKIHASPIIILISQVIVVASGVIPLFFICKKVLKEDLWIALIILLYLLYPAVEFNSVADFHPDHIFIPLSLWAYYLFYKERYILSVIMIGIGAMAKEPFLLAASFWGIYLVIKKQRYLLGMFSILFFLSFFLIVIFYIHPLINPHFHEHGINVMQEAVFSHVGKIFTQPDIFIAGVSNGLIKKMLFFIFLFCPFLFLPLIEWREIIPAIPFLAIPFLSATPAHSNIESQYTAGIIAPLFIAFVFFIERINKKRGKKYTNALLFLITVLIITFHFAKSPSPLGVNFWKPAWSETWNYQNYKSGRHEENIRKVMELIPEDADKIVVAQTNLNLKRLSHRNHYYPFPDKWEDADFILLDRKKPLMVGDHTDEKIYNQELEKIINNPLFRLVYNHDGILLFAAKPLYSEE